MKPKQILAVTKYNFRRWHKNPRIVITFCLAFVLCFLLSDKAVKFAKEYETTMQPVSYTHLDVYKRQTCGYAALSFERGD